MRLNDILNKTKRGETLTEKETDFLAQKLGLVDSISSLGVKIILTVLICILAVFLRRDA